MGVTITRPFQPVTTRVFLPAASFAPVSGAPTLSASTTNDLGTWLLDASSNERITTAALVPTGWSTFDVDVWWTNAGAGSGNVVLQVAYRSGYGDGEPATVTTSPSAVTATAPAQAVAEVTQLTTGISVPTAGEVLAVRIARNASDAADTLANDIGVIGVMLTKAS